MQKFPEISNESSKALLKKIACDDFEGIDQTIICSFRKSIKNGTIEENFQALTEELKKAKGIQYSRFLFLNYLACNWMPINKFEKIKRCFRQTALNLVDRPKPCLKNSQDANLLDFNKAFAFYTSEYLSNIELTFSLKHIHICPETYVQCILKGKIGFEGIIYMTHNLNASFLLLEKIWPCLKCFENKQECLFKFLLEIITTRIFEEYLFIKRIIKACVSVYHWIVKSNCFDSFVCLFYEFSWKNKKLVSVYEDHKEFFRENLIRFPALYNFEPHISAHLNLMVAEKMIQIIHIKEHIKRLSADFMAKLTVDYAEKASGCELYRKGKIAIFDKKDILGFLDSLKNSSKTFKKPISL